MKIVDEYRWRQLNKIYKYWPTQIIIYECLWVYMWAYMEENKIIFIIFAYSGNDSYRKFYKIKIKTIHKENDGWAMICDLKKTATSKYF